MEGHVYCPLVKTVLCVSDEFGVWLKSIRKTKWGIKEFKHILSCYPGVVSGKRNQQVYLL